MALQFYDGFDHYNAGQTARKWSSVVGNTTSLNPGRFGGRALQFNNVGVTSYVEQILSSQATFYTGFAFSCAYGDASAPILRWMDGTSDQIDLRVTSTAGFQITRNGTPLGTSADDVIAFGFYNYIEMRVTFNNSTGTVQLRVNGTDVINQSSLDTTNTANAFANRIRLQPFATSGSYDIRFDDLYILDSTGSSPHNAFLGECRVETHYPSANGTFVEFSPVGAGANYQCVQETPADDDTTYTVGNSIGNRDLYTLSPYSFVGTIYGVQNCVTHRKDDVGNRTIAPLTRVSSTLYEGTQDPCLSQYKVTRTIWARNPNTGNLWTVADVNAAQFGLIIKG